MQRGAKVSFLLMLAAGWAAAEVTVWQDTLMMLTHVEGPPDVNPRFDLFHGGQNSFYPYTMRVNFTSETMNHAWRTLNLENEYLKCTVFPDLGGHLYSCLDKLSGRQMFYTNPTIKKAWIALRGSWAALGIELNFPVTHSWTTVSPVDFATSRNPDGSASVWVGAIDRVYGMQWRVEFTLRPGVAVLEQKVTLYNRSDVRHRYLWWSNAAVEEEDSKTTFIFPTYLTLTHGAPVVDTWPVNSQSVDLSVVGNHIGGGLGLFAFGSRETFFGVYQPTSRSGVAHYAELSDLPGKKFWTWQSEGDKFARSYLSDNNSTYVEIQGGVFGDQSSFGFLEPQQVRRFTEYWMPVRDLGGITRANTHAVLNLQRSQDATGLTVEMNPNHAMSGATVRVLNGAQVVFEETVNLDPAVKYSRMISGVSVGAKHTFRLLDGTGAVLLEHTENTYDALTPSEFPPGPQPAPDYSVQTTEEDYLEVSNYNELNGNLVLASGDYQRGLRQFPGSFGLLKAAGRLSVSLSRYSEAAQRLLQAQAQAPDDPEVHYYLGLAHSGLGDSENARKEWQAIRTDPGWGRAASLQLALLLARAGDHAAALDALRTGFAGSPDTGRAGAVELALLRQLGRWEEAAQRLAHWRSADPADSLFRFEATVLGTDDPALWRHLAADPERVLDIATHYMEMGLFQNALQVLDRYYPAVNSMEAEPGAVLPQNYPLVVYYRAYCKDQSGGSGNTDYLLAPLLSTRNVFPSRPGSRAVLEAAVRARPSDATAHYLLGSLYMSFYMVDHAIAEWEKARAIRKDLPALHRNLGRALLDLRGDPLAAVAVLQEGAGLDPSNSDLQSALRRAQNLISNTAQPRFTAEGAVNAASYAGGAVAPGEMIAIFGSDMGPDTLAGLALDSFGHVATILSGTRVLFDGLSAPVVYVQKSQLSVVVPYGVDGKTSTQIQVERNGVKSSAVSMPVVASVPGVFTLDASGRGPGAILNPDYSVNSASNPARVGSFVIIYATGEGQTAPPGVDGVITSDISRWPVQLVSVTIGGVPADVLYAGPAPGLVAGVMQINATVPQGVAPGSAVPVVVKAGNASSRPDVTVAIAP